MKIVSQNTTTLSSATAPGNNQPQLVATPVPDEQRISFWPQHNLMPGSSLLSHGETPHYHRRYGVSLLSSAWGQVGPPR